MSESLQRLRELVQLLESGHISREEFERAKQKALAEQQTIESSADTSFPDKVGPYQLLGLIGEGGMGRVFRAQHEDSTIRAQQGGEVALKLLHAQHARNTKTTQRFRQEAALGMRLKHPGIVQVLELVEDGPIKGLVMEYVRGQTLRERLEQRNEIVPWKDAKPVISRLVEAVNYAHTSGVVHRDIKPDNIILTDTGHLKVLDFGIAKSDNANLTQTGYGLGTADYMAPEQFTDAKGVDGRADVYSIGVILYQMLTNRLPWKQHSGADQLLYEKRSGQLPPPQVFEHSIPTELGDLVMRMLQPEANHRFQDLSELNASIAALGHMMGQRTLPPSPQTRQVTAPPSSRPQRKMNKGLALVALVMVAAGIVIWATVNAIENRKDNPDRQDEITEEAPSETDSIDENDDGFNRKDFRIIIRSNDSDSAKDLARELRSEGYRVTNVESDLGYEIISWNGLPEPLLEEILAMMDEHLDIDTDEILVLEDDELPSGDIFLDLLLLDDITEEAPSETDSIDENDDGFNRKDFRIIIRSNDSDSAKDLARELRSEGYRVTNVESDLGYEIISWNGLPEPLLEEILAMMDEHLDIDTDEILVLEDDELPSGDIFLDLLLLDDIDTSE